MSFQVFFQIPLLRELSITKVAFVRLDSQVHSRMVNEVPGLVERFFTPLVLSVDDPLPSFWTPTGHIRYGMLVGIQEVSFPNLRAWRGAFSCL